MVNRAQDDGDSAARAFDQLRGEVSLLRRALEALTAERRAQPDYSATLESMDARIEALRGWARKLAEQPAIKLTPQDIASQIESAVKVGREAQATQTAQARGALDRALTDLNGSLARVLSAAEQRRWMLVSNAGTAIVCAALGAWLI